MVVSQKIVKGYYWDEDEVGWRNGDECRCDEGDDEKSDGSGVYIGGDKWT